MAAESTLKERLDAQKQSETIGNVYKIQRFCINDGPGIRTTVFLKGCQLSCKWCHNPETISSGKDILLNSQLCKLCGKCLPVCSNGCHTIEESLHTLNREFCGFCGRCVMICPNKAIEIAGGQISIDDVMSVVKRDEIYYAESRGGVTISGGEPLLQREFVCRLIDACKDRGYSVYIDTNGSAGSELFSSVIKSADGVLFDLKMIDADKHRRYTGADNNLILKNFEYLCGTDKDLIVRYVVIPQINDSAHDLSLLAEFLKKSGFSGTLELLAYHRLGLNKYSSLNIEYEAAGIEPPSIADMEAITAYFTGKGFNAIFSN